MYCRICNEPVDYCECSSEGEVFTSFTDDPIFHGATLSWSDDPGIFTPKTQEDLQHEAVRIKALQVRQLKNHLGLMR